MTVHHVDHYQQNIAKIGAVGCYQTLAGIERLRALHRTSDGGTRQVRALDAKSDACLRLCQLTDETLHRVAVYVAGGLVGGGVVLAAGNVGSERHTWWGWLLIGVPLTWLSFIGVVALIFVVLRVVIGALRWSLPLAARMSTRSRVGLFACLVALAGALVVLVGPGPVRHTIAGFAVFVFPCAIVIGVGGRLAVLTYRRWHVARWRWQRNAGYVLLALVAAAAMLTLGARDTLAAQATVGLLVPVAVWAAVRTWRSMNSCSLIGVRAVTDIAVSVVLGLTLVALVWLADALRMPSTEGATVREALRLTGKYIELPQWWWIGLYVLLAGASVLFARGYPQPDRRPVEVTFSRLSPRRHPRMADRPASWRLASDRVHATEPRDPRPARIARTPQSSYIGATSLSTPRTAPARLGRRSFRSPQMLSRGVPARRHRA
jgi:hypothetical protein